MGMRITNYIFVIAMGTTLLPSCATMLRGVNDELIIDTDPPGAVVTTDRKLKTNHDGTIVYARCEATPCTIKMPRRSEFLMTIEKEGYETVEIGVDSSMKKEALRSNLSSSGKAGLAFGVSTVAAFGGYASSTGAAAAGGAAVAGIATAGILGATLIVDGASGALLNLNPNPIVLELPPAGTVVVPHDKALEIRRKRDGDTPIETDDINGGSAEVLASE
jgi:hypothetical protein